MGFDFHDWSIRPYSMAHEGEKTRQKEIKNPAEMWTAGFNRKRTIEHFHIVDCRCAY